MLARSLLNLLFILPVILVSQDERLRLKQADLLENKTINGQAVQILTGNVIFTKGQTTIRCNTARYHEKTGQGTLTGNVIMDKEDQNLKADSVHYDSPKNKFTCYHSVHVWDNDYDLTADTVVYFSELDSGNATGHAKLIQKQQTITAHALRYVKQEGENAVSYTAENNVTIIEGERTATCGWAFYDVRNDQTTLKISPKLTEKGRILEGSEIVLNYTDDELDMVWIPSKAHALNRSSGFREIKQAGSDSVAVQRRNVEFEDDMSGSVLKGFFKEGLLDSVRLEGMATTLYHIFEDSLYQGNNLATGDTIILDFIKNDSAEVDLQSIEIFGGSRGVFKPDSTNREMESPIVYTSEKILYDLNAESTDLAGEASIQYSDVDLNSGFINVDWNQNVLKAFPTAPMDTISSIKKPTIVEQGKDPMTGDTLIYNLKSKKGRVKQGRSKADDGYYAGNEIRNSEQKIYFIQNSSYTTCSLETPHFHFESNNMKIINQDKVIARPIVLYISRIPILGFPFGIFPHKTGGRHSGWIMPGYGENSVRGQYFNGLGYYWAPNDYWGTRFTTSFGDRQGIVFNLDNNYNVRYKFDGSLNLKYKQFLSGTNNIVDIGSERSTSYDVYWRHNQKLRHEQSFNVNASYSSSGEFRRKYSDNPVERMNQNAISNASYSKRWPALQASLSANLSSNTNLMADEQIDPSSVYYTLPKRENQQISITNATLPSMSFFLSQRDLIPGKGGVLHWYNNIKWKYNTSFTNKERTFYETENFWLDDTTYAFQWNDEKEHFNDNIMRHSLAINAPTKIFRYITFNPSVNVNSDWVTRTFTGRLDSATNATVSTEVPGFAIRTTGNMSASLNTQIYGLFPINLMNAIAIRHVISPSIGYSFSPDFSQPLFGNDMGYFETLLDTAGNKLYHDRFSGTLAGGTPRNESQAMNFSVNNNFQMKWKDGEKEKIVNLFSWRLGSSYNFVADEFPLSNLSSSINSTIGKTKIDVSMTHDFYEFDLEHNQRLNQLRKTENGILFPRLTKVDLSTGFQFSGKKIGSRISETDTIGTDSIIADNYNPLTSQQQDGGSLWSTRFSVGYSLQKTNPNNPIETFWLNTNTSLNITKNWSISYSARFNLLNNELISHSFAIHRDLHCWELSMNWTPSGYASGFYLRINVKSPTLRDLKIEQKGGFNRVIPL